MTTFNTDYNNTEDSLLDQELTIEQLEAVAGGRMPLEAVAGGDSWLGGWWNYIGEK